MPYKLREKRIEQSRRYYQENREKVKKKQKERYRKQKEENPEKLRQWHREHLRQKRASDLAYRIRGLGAGRKQVPITIRRQIIQRAEGRCEMEGEHKGSLLIHHIDGNYENNSLSNLLLICRRHHQINHQAHKNLNKGRPSKADPSNSASRI